MPIQRDTPLEDSRQGCCVLATQELLLTLPAMDIQGVLIRKHPYLDLEASTDSQIKLPCQIVSPAGRRHNPDAGPTQQDDFQYLVMVTTMVADNRDNSDSTIGWLMRVVELVEDLFTNKRYDVNLPAGSCVTRVTIEPGDEYIEQAYRRNIEAAFQLVVWNVRRDRGD